MTIARPPGQGGVRSPVAWWRATSEGVLTRRPARGESNRTTGSKKDCLGEVKQRYTCAQKVCVWHKLPCMKGLGGSGEDLASGRYWIGAEGAMGMVGTAVGLPDPRPPDSNNTEFKKYESYEQVKILREHRVHSPHMRTCQCLLFFSVFFSYEYFIYIYIYYKTTPKAAVLACLMPRP